MERRELGLTACLLAALAPAAAGAQEWQLIHGMTARQFSAELDAAKGDDLVPIEVDVVERDGERRYTAIWIDGMGSDWAHRRDLDVDTMTAKTVEFASAGLMPASLSVEVVDGEPRYDVLWLPHDGDAAELTYGRPQASMADDLDRYIERGFLPVAISGYVHAGDVHYSTSWRENSDGIAWTVRYGMSAAEFEDHVRTVAADGMLPFDVSAFRVDGQTRFAAISMRMDGVLGEVGIGLSAAEVNAHPAAAGSRPAVFAEYDTPAGARFVVGWYRAAGDDSGAAVSSSPAATAASDVSGKDVILPIAPAIQQTPVWCWVAVGEMVFRHLGVGNANPGGNFQCGIIGRLSPPGSPCDIDCRNCIVPSGSNAGTLNMLTEYSRLQTGRAMSFVEDTRIDPDAFVREIDGGRPVLVGVSTNRREFGQAEHVALVVGYAKGDGELNLVVNDPFPYPSSSNPYLANGGTPLAAGRYRIPYSAFRDGVFWHWTVHSLRWP